MQVLVAKKQIDHTETHSFDTTNGQMKWANCLFVCTFLSHKLVWAYLGELLSLVRCFCFVSHTESLSLQWTHFYCFYHNFFIVLASEWKMTQSLALYCLMDFCTPTHTFTIIHTHTHTDGERKKRKNELLIMPSNYGVWPWERYDPGEITSNSHLSQQIEWKTLVRGERRGKETRGKKRGQERRGDKRPTLLSDTTIKIC